ncbi:helix-turn-helix transcriptional regulator [Amycolatopsis jejuensis]|uniref:helix-turn-helix transcriptional regulator n=1 Tax=Amycolatopsis jejuensis TaxID=330084 RepID=UPI00068D65BE|nr:LuxR C-terminal-related transcriptional regulator [Amycolatopsis jejuensis]
MNDTGPPPAGATRTLPPLPDHATALPGTWWLPYVPGGAAVAQWADSAPPERRRALRAIGMANRGADRETVAREAEAVLRSPAAHDLLSWWCAVFALIHAGAADLAQHHCVRRARGPDATQREFATALHARLRVLRGAPDEGAAMLSDLLGRTRQPMLRELLVAWSVLALVDGGAIDAATALIVDHACDPVILRYQDKAELFAAAGHLEFAAGRHDVARGNFLECGRLLMAAGVHNPAVQPWRSRAALCAEAAGRHRLAAVLAERELLLARRWSGTWALGVAAHAHAVVVKRNPESVRRAADLLAESAAIEELLRARYDLAHFLSSAQRYSEAREVLRSAAGLAARNGYHGWSNRVEQALRRLARQAGDHLTPQERKIAGLARTGLSNRRIAEQECLTVRTVEFHLSSVYRKLGIAGRAELSGIPAGLDPPG